jgi:integrative and conjugative element protein (TIGR02256 family)
MVVVQPASEPGLSDVSRVRDHFQRPRLLMPAAALGELLTEAWRAWPNETGGVLLGVSRPSELRLTVAIGPGPNASHRPGAFAPDSAWQARQVAEAWELDHTIGYLGDWHTHPRGTPTLSGLDRDALHSIADFPAAQQSQPVMLVLALGPDGSIRVAAQRLVNRCMVALIIDIHG